jgi:hypothetical protein
MAVKTFYFELPSEESLVHVDASFSGENYILALDTGASNTVIDLAAMIIAGYDLSQSIETVPIETGKGILDAYLFEVKTFTSLGITKKNFKICAYDFFSHHVFSDIHGVLGLDFFKENTFCINLKKQIILIQ